MKIGHSSDGFTLVETLIVVAIMGVLFIIAFINLSQTQHNTAFKTSVFDLQQQIQSIINKAEYATYNDTGNVTCTGTPGSAPILVTGSTAQGTNSSCYFIGLGLAFRSSEIQTVPLAIPTPTGAGAVNDLSEQSISNVAPLAPTNPAFTTITQVSPDETQYYDLPSGLVQEEATSDPGTINGGPNYIPGLYASDAYFIAFGFNSYAAGAGADNLIPYVVENPYINYSQTDYTNFWAAHYNQYIGDYFWDSTLYPAVYITECYDSGTTSQSALFTINQNSQATGTLSGGLDVTTTIYQNLYC